jgi:hypothetical protein
MDCFAQVSESVPARRSARLGVVVVLLTSRARRTVVIERDVAQIEDEWRAQQQQAKATIDAYYRSSTWKRLPYVIGIGPCTWLAWRSICTSRSSRSDRGFGFGDAACDVATLGLVLRQLQAALEVE